MKQRSASVHVFRLNGFNRASGPHHGRARWEQVFRVTPAEASLLEYYGYAQWRGKHRKAITLLIPMRALLLFVGQMRFKPAPSALGIDSKTHKNLGGLRGYKHVRNLSYTPLADQLMALGPDSKLGVELANLFRAEEAATLGLVRNEKLLTGLSDSVRKLMPEKTI